MSIPCLFMTEKNCERSPRQRYTGNHHARRQERLRRKFLDEFSWDAAEAEAKAKRLNTRHPLDQPCEREIPLRPPVVIAQLFHQRLAA